MSYAATSQVRRVRFAGLSPQSSNFEPLDGTIDTLNECTPSPQTYQARWSDLKKKMSWKDIIPRVEYPGWPSAAFKAPPLVQWLKYFALTLLIGATFSAITLGLFLFVFNSYKYLKGVLTYE